MKNLLQILKVTLKVIGSLLPVFVMCFGTNASAQTTQTVKGIVIDQQSKLPAPGIIVEVISDSDRNGAATDADGKYVIHGVKLGHVTLRFTGISYQEQYQSDILVQSGKETVVNAEMLESVNQIKEVIIKGKETPITEKQMATVSAHIFNADDTRRYAGSRNDVARMAANFAGAMSNNDSRNDIIIRGNAPTGLLWRIEGIDVANPNHFGDMGATGGPVSMINNNVLGKSAFYTGAFPAQYGNATAGAFDINLREGNHDKREFVAQVGFNGLELGGEGYFSKKSAASYLIDYRYSVPGLLNSLGVNMGTGGALPQYQDISYKIVLPTAHAGKFELFGVGGASSISFKGDLKDTANFYNDPYSNLAFSSKTGVTGISHSYFINNTTSTRVTVAAVGSGAVTVQDSLDNDRVAAPVYREHAINNKLVVRAVINKKFSAKDRLTGGATLQNINYNFADSTQRIGIGLSPLHNSKGSTNLMQAYLQWQHRFSDALTLNGGLYAQFLSLNNTYSIEPRAGLRYNVGRGALSFGYGKHSQMQNMTWYLLQTPNADGTYTETNKNLDFTKSQHFVAGWESAIGNHWSYKTEVYYQYLYNVPVTKTASSFSTLNTGTSYDETKYGNLVNSGTGRNYGIELTINRAFSRGFYLMNTTSVYQSLYTASDHVERNTAFNNKYIINLLAGKEWQVSKKGTFCLDLKMSYAGGKRYTPILLAASIQQGSVVYDESNAFSSKFQDYFRTDLKMTYRKNGDKVMQEWFISLMNVTNNKNVFRQGFDNRANVVRTQYQLGFTPSVNYRIQF